MKESNNYSHKTKMKVVIMDGKEVAYNPEEEEDPRLVAEIMEIEKNEEYIEVEDIDEYFENMRKEARKTYHMKDQ